MPRSLFIKELRKEVVSVILLLFAAAIFLCLFSFLIILLLFSVLSLFGLERAISPEFGISVLIESLIVLFKEADIEAVINS